MTSGPSVSPPACGVRRLAFPWEKPIPAPSPPPRSAALLPRMTVDERAAAAAAAAAAGRANASSRTRRKRLSCSQKALHGRARSESLAALEADDFDDRLPSNGVTARVSAGANSASFFFFAVVSASTSVASASLSSSIRGRLLLALLSPRFRIQSAPDSAGRVRAPADSAPMLERPRGGGGGGGGPPGEDVAMASASTRSSSLPSLGSIASSPCWREKVGLKGASGGFVGPRWIGSGAIAAQQQRQQRSTARQMTRRGRRSFHGDITSCREENEGARVTYLSPDSANSNGIPHAGLRAGLRSTGNQD
jgi:hypothetical protein